MSVKVGLGTSTPGSATKARMRARAKVVLPAPRPPDSATASPLASAAARSPASTSVAASSGRSMIEGASPAAMRREPILFRRGGGDLGPDGQAADDRHAAAFLRRDVDRAAM